MGGKDFPLYSNDEILGIKSPKENVGQEGPHVVVFKDTDNRWAIVAMDWDERPSLGIRWFWGNSGHPSAFGNPQWFVIPSELNESILLGLPLTREFSDLLKGFLADEIPGKALHKWRRSMLELRDLQDALDRGEELGLSRRELLSVFREDRPKPLNDRERLDLFHRLGLRCHEGERLKQSEVADLAGVGKPTVKQYDAGRHL